MTKVYPTIVFYMTAQIIELAFTERLKCNELKQPENGYFVGGVCSNDLGNACAIKCQIGYKQYGSSYRICFYENATWSGFPTRCEIIRCKQLISNDLNLELNCTRDTNEYGTSCFAVCKFGYTNIGSTVRHCLPLGIWSGLEAKCKKITHFNVKPTENYESTTTTSLEFETYEDLSNRTLSFDYSLKKIDLIIDIKSLPITFISWIKTKFTTNIKIFQYNYKCNEILVLTDSNSSIFLNINKIYNYKLRKTLIKNEWTQVAFIQTDLVWQLFLDGSLQVDIHELRLVSNCDDTHDLNANEGNQFKISESKPGEKYHSMRGDLTHTYLYNAQLSEEAVLRNIFMCEKIENVMVAFDWSNVLISKHLRKFKKKLNGFCIGCSYPEFVKHAIVNYQGSKTGSIRWYKCMNGYKMIGFASSICMVHGSWSSRAPRCKVIH